VVGSAEDCERSELCKRQGYCGFASGKCVLESNADCQKSDICRVSGRCTYEFKPDRSSSLPEAGCIVGSNADCRQSSNCKEFRSCIMRKGECVSK
jgi:hypothetical protein